MRLLYIAPTIINMEQLDGVAKKIMAHVEVFSKKYDVMLLYRDDENVLLYRISEGRIKNLASGSTKFDILRAAFGVVQEEKFDCCYIRYPYSDPIFLALLKKLKRHKVRVAVEIPTYPYDEEGKESLKGRLIHAVDVIYRKKLPKYVGRIVTYSSDITIFGVETIRTVNGLDFEKVDIASCCSNSDTIHLCGVATFHRIHGYDRLIEGLRLYYKNGGKRKVVFDVVGYGDNDILQEYKNIVNKAQLDESVVFHGKLHGRDLDNVYNLATVGINSLAIHRQNLENESTLKTREYAAKGLPILSSSYVDAFDNEGNIKYVFRVSADDSPINIEEVICYIDNLYMNEDINSIKREIRTRAQKICDMPVTLSPVIDYFNS